MKYFIDTEFIEGFHKPLFGKRRHFIDLISIGVVAEDGREYYAISNEFDLKEGWNKCDKKINENYKPSFGGGSDGVYNPMYIKEYWLRENVLKPLYFDLMKNNEGRYFVGNYLEYRNLTLPFVDKAIKKYGKSNKQIAEDIIKFIWHEDYKNFGKNNDLEFISRGRKYGWNGDSPEFYGYYADYDWVLFCSLFGRMIDLPKGFPMYCMDLKQTIDEKAKALNDGWAIPFEKVTLENRIKHLKNNLTIQSNQMNIMR